jgi:hypothetical protein
MPVSPPLAAGGEICTASDLLALLTITDSYITHQHAYKVLFVYCCAQPPTLYAPSYILLLVCCLVLSSLSSQLSTPPL